MSLYVVLSVSVCVSAAESAGIWGVAVLCIRARTVARLRVCTRARLYVCGYVHVRVDSMIHGSFALPSILVEGFCSTEVYLSLKAALLIQPI